MKTTLVATLPPNARSEAEPAAPRPIGTNKWEVAHEFCIPCSETSPPVEGKADISIPYSEDCFGVEGKADISIPYSEDYFGVEGKADRALSRARHFAKRAAKLTEKEGVSDTSPNSRKNRWKRTEVALYLITLLQSIIRARASKPIALSVSDTPQQVMAKKIMAQKKTALYIFTFLDKLGILHTAAKCVLRRSRPINPLPPLPPPPILDLYVRRDSLTSDPESDSDDSSSLMGSLSERSSSSSEVTPDYGTESELFSGEDDTVPSFASPRSVEADIYRGELFNGVDIYGASSEAFVPADEDYEYPDYSHLIPQAAIFDTIKTNMVLTAAKQLGLHEKICTFTENTLTTMAALVDCTTMRQFFAIMLIYFKTMYSPSVVLTASTYIATLFGAKLETQGATVQVDDFKGFVDGRPQWLNELKDLSTTWTLALHSESFSKVGKLISFCVALGMCQISDIVPTVGGFELFTLPTPPKQVTVISLVDCVFDLVIHYVEGGYLCFTTGSIKPLLYGSFDHQLYSEMYFRCLRCSSLHKAGNLAVEGIDDNDFDQLLNATIEKCDLMLLGAHGSLEKSIFMRQKERLNVWLTEFSETRLTGGLRVSPYTIGLFGETSVGKSTLCPLIMSYTLMANGYSAEDNRIITIEDKDKYMSNQRSYVNGIIYDDAGNTKPEFSAVASSDVIIQITNNTPAYANMAGVELKGKVAIRPKVFIVTKNIKDAGASFYSNCPTSVCRRDTITVTVVVKPQFALCGMLHSPYVKAAFPEGTPMYPDLWFFTIQRAVPEENKVQGGQAHPVWVDCTYNGVAMRDVDLKTFLLFLRDDTYSHFEAQEQVVYNGTDVAKRMHICKACNLPADLNHCVECQKYLVPDTRPKLTEVVDPLSHLRGDIKLDTLLTPTGIRSPQPPLDPALESGTPILVPEPDATFDLVQTVTFPAHFEDRESDDDDVYHFTSNNSEQSDRDQDEDEEPEYFWSAREELARGIIDSVPSQAPLAHLGTAHDFFSAETPETPQGALDDDEPFFSVKESIRSSWRWITGFIDDSLSPADSWFDTRFDWIDVFCSKVWKKSSFIPLTIGNYLGTKVSKKFLSAVGKFAPISYNRIKRLEKASTQVLMERVKALDTSVYMNWTTYIPEDWFDTDTCSEIICRTEWPLISKRAAIASWRSWMEIVGGTGLTLRICAFVRSCSPELRQKMGWIPYLILASAWSAALVAPSVRIAQAYRVERAILIAEIAERRDLAHPLLKEVRDQHYKKICAGSAIIAATVTIIFAYRRMSKTYRSIQSVQGCITPNTIADIETRDAEANPWCRVVPEEYIAPTKSKCIDFADLRRLAEQNVTHMHLTVGTKKYICDAFFPCSNVALIPKHMWMADEMDAVFTRRDAGIVGSQFKAKVSKQFSVDIPNNDMSLVWIPSGGDWKDLTSYFPLTHLTGVTPARLVHRLGTGELLSSKLSVRADRIRIDNVTPYQGGTYTLEWDTFQGLCMSPLICETKTPMIIGFHLSGKNGSTLGAMGTLLQSEFQSAILSLRSNNVIMLSKSDTPHDKAALGVQFFEGGEPHRKSATRFLTGMNSCRIHGPTIGMSTQRTTVHTSPISHLITEICDVPQQWGPPKLQEGYKWQESLEYSSKPAIGFAARPVTLAVKSYEEKLARIGSGTLKTLLQETMPLTDVDNVNGIDGKRFIDAMKSSTAIGYPLTGPKERYFQPVDLPSHMNAKEFADPKFFRELARVEDEYRMGRRTTQVFKACMKDEPTSLEKEKVRIFQAAPVVLQLGVRKYFLPIARLLSLFPTVSECAVGINAESREWEQMHNYFTAHGESRILAGDYSKYDLRMPAQLMFCAFKILTNFARRCSYTEDDINVMEGFATEICYAYTAYNGDLVKFLGSNPSGQNLTVYINSIVNSLLLRTCFFTLFPNATPDAFNEAVNAITYGDDVVSSVHWRYYAFNHISFANFLEVNDMKFTMPDKKSRPKRFMAISEVDFLKRKSFFNPDIGCTVGILDDMSIFKSLHCQMKSSHVLPLAIAAQNIDGALRSWFYHGRQVYEKRQSQMAIVAARADLEHMCSMLTRSYDDLVLAWKLADAPPPEKKSSP